MYLMQFKMKKILILLLFVSFAGYSQNFQANKVYAKDSLIWNTGNNKLKAPTVKGIPGQVVTMPVSGNVLTWSTPATGTNYWTQTDYDLYPNDSSWNLLAGTTTSTHGGATYFDKFLILNYLWFDAADQVAAMGKNAGKYNFLHRDNNATGSSYFGDAAGMNAFSYRGTYIGSNAGKMIVTGEDATVIGADALSTAESASRNTVVGAYAMKNTNTAVVDNTFIGYAAGQGYNGSRGIGIGKYAGTNTSLSDRLWITNFNGGSAAGDSTKSILYGYMDATYTNQRLTANSKLFLPLITAGASNTTYLTRNASTNEVQYRSLPTSLEDTASNSIWRLSPSGYAYPRSATRVGIGTSAPAYPLDVYGGIGTKVIQTTSGYYPCFTSVLPHASVSGVDFSMTTSKSAFKIRAYNTNIGYPSLDGVLFLDDAGSMGFYTVNTNKIISFGTNNNYINPNMLIGYNGYLGLNLNSGIIPTYPISLGGNFTRTIGMERHTTANTAGNNLTLLAGGASTGATDKTGGDLLLSGGIATGDKTSNVLFYTATAGSAGTTSNTPSEKMRLTGDGQLLIGTTSGLYKTTINGNLGIRDVMAMNDTTIIAKDGGYRNNLTFGSTDFKETSMQASGSSFTAIADTANITSSGIVRMAAGKYEIENIPKSDTSKYILTWNEATGEVKAQQEPGHFYGYYTSNGGTVRIFAAPNTYYPLVVTLTYPETHGFTADNDTAQITYNYPASHIKFDIKIIMSGTNGQEIDAQLYNVTDAAEVPTSQQSIMGGATNRTQIALTCYDINASPGDVYQLRVKNVGASSDIVIYRIMWFGQVIHY